MWSPSEQASTNVPPTEAPVATGLDVASIASGLERRELGVWFARGQQTVSYPPHGNADCFAIEDRSFWFRHRNRCIIDLVRRFPPTGTLLDIGGGNGFVARGLLDAGIPCALLEPGVDGALAASARGVEPVICATLESAGLSACSLSAAGLFDVIEHIEDDVGVLREVWRLIKPAGALFLTVPAYQFLYSRDDEVAGHYRRYTLRSLGRALTEAGFRTAFASYIFAPLPPLVFLSRTVPSWLGLRHGDIDADSHTQRGLAGHLLDLLLDLEYAAIQTGRVLPVGGTCLCVAVKD